MQILSKFATMIRAACCIDDAIDENCVKLEKNKSDSA